MPDDTTPLEPGIRADQPLQSQSRAAAMRAQVQGTIARYPWPTDSSDPRQMDRLAGVVGDENMPPADSGIWYLFHVIDKDRKRRFMVVGEGTVLETLTALALVTQGYDVAKTYTAHPWTLV